MNEIKMARYFNQLNHGATRDLRAVERAIDAVYGDRYTPQWCTETRALVCELPKWGVGAKLVVVHCSLTNNFKRILNTQTAMSHTIVLRLEYIKMFALTRLKAYKQSSHDFVDSYFMSFTPYDDTNDAINEILYILDCYHGQ